MTPEERAGQTKFRVLRNHFSAPTHVSELLSNTETSFWESTTTSKGPESGRCLRRSPDWSLFCRREVFCSVYFLRLLFN